MSLTKLLKRWVGILEDEYGIAANPIPATDDELSQLEEFWGCALEPELRELYEFSNGLYHDERAVIFPFHFGFPPIQHVLSYVTPTFHRSEFQVFPDSHIDFLTDPQRSSLIEDPVLISVDSGLLLGVVCSGTMSGAVYAIDWGAPLFSWAARSLTDLFESCLWYYDSGYLEFDNQNHSILEASPGCPQHPKLTMPWTLLPYEQKYDGDAAINEWRWEQ